MNISLYNLLVAGAGFFLWFIVTCEQTLGQQYNLVTQRLQAQLLFLFPIKWKSFEIPALYERRKPFLNYGPYSFAIWEGCAVFVTDPNDELHTIVQINWNGHLEKRLRVNQRVGPFSDIVYHEGYLYVGCVREPRLLVFDVQQGRLIKDVHLINDQQKTLDIGVQQWNLPKVARLGVDKSGNIHAVIRTNLGLKTQKLTVSKDGQRLGPPIVGLWTPSEVDHFDKGVVSPYGEWFYPRRCNLEIEEGTYVSQNQLWCITSKGKVEPFDRLSNVLYGLPGSIRELVGFDGQGRLWAVVTLINEGEDKSVDLGPYLISWQGMDRQAWGKIVTNPGNLRAPGCRHTIVTPSGAIYMLVALSPPAFQGEQVSLYLARLR